MKNQPLNNKQRLQLDCSKGGNRGLVVVRDSVFGRLPRDEPTSSHFPLYEAIGHEFALQKNAELGGSKQPEAVQGMILHCPSTSIPLSPKSGRGTELLSPARRSGRFGSSEHRACQSSYDSSEFSEQRSIMHTNVDS